MPFDMKEHRRKLRMKKPPLLDRRNEYTDTDLTPHNASRVMRQGELARVCFGPEITYK